MNLVSNTKFSVVKFPFVSFSPLGSNSSFPFISSVFAFTAWNTVLAMALRPLSDHCTADSSLAGIGWLPLTVGHTYLGFLCLAVWGRGLHVWNVVL